MDDDRRSRTVDPLRREDDEEMVIAKGGGQLGRSDAERRLPAPLGHDAGKGCFGDYSRVTRAFPTIEPGHFAGRAADS